MRRPTLPAVVAPLAVTAAGCVTAIIVAIVVSWAALVEVLR